MVQNMFQFCTENSPIFISALNWNSKKKNIKYQKWGALPGSIYDVTKSRKSKKKRPKRTGLTQRRKTA